MTTSYTEGFHRAEFIRSIEDEGSIAYDNVTLISGQNLKAGTVLGKITASGKYTRVDNHTPATDGSQTAVAVLLADVDASAGDTACVVVSRLAEVSDAMLTYAASATGGEKTSAKAALAAVNIIVR